MVNGGRPENQQNPSGDEKSPTSNFFLTRLIAHLAGEQSDRPASAPQPPVAKAPDAAPGPAPVSTYSSENDPTRPSVPVKNEPATAKVADQAPVQPAAPTAPAAPTSVVEPSAILNKEPEAPQQTAQPTQSTILKGDNPGSEKPKPNEAPASSTSQPTQGTLSSTEGADMTYKGSAKEGQGIPAGKGPEPRTPVSQSAAEQAAKAKAEFNAMDAGARDLLNKDAQPRLVVREQVQPTPFDARLFWKMVWKNARWPLAAIVTFFGFGSVAAAAADIASDGEADFTELLTPEGQQEFSLLLSQLQSGEINQSEFLAGVDDLRSRAAARRVRPSGSDNDNQSAEATEEATQEATQVATQAATQEASSEPSQEATEEQTATPAVVDPQAMADEALQDFVLSPEESAELEAAGWNPLEVLPQLHQQGVIGDIQMVEAVEMLLENGTITPEQAASLLTVEITPDLIRTHFSYFSEVPWNEDFTLFLQACEQAGYENPLYNIGLRSIQADWNGTTIFFRPNGGVFEDGSGSMDQPDFEHGWYYHTGTLRTTESDGPIEVELPGLGDGEFSVQTDNYVPGQSGIKIDFFSNINRSQKIGFLEAILKDPRLVNWVAGMLLQRFPKFEGKHVLFELMDYDYNPEHSEEWSEQADIDGYFEDIGTGFDDQGNVNFDGRAAVTTGDSAMRGLLSVMDEFQEGGEGTGGEIFEVFAAIANGLNILMELPPEAEPTQPVGTLP